MTPETKKIFKAIFSEAHVVDIDFSAWDKKIRLTVIAGHVAQTYKKPGYFHHVDFCEVSGFSWKSHHLGILPLSSKDHCQWEIIESKLKRIWLPAQLAKEHYVNAAGRPQRRFWDVTFRHVSGPRPEINIQCRDIAISAEKRDIFDLVNPTWGKSGAGLARPSINELYKTISAWRNLDRP